MQNGIYHVQFHSTQGASGEGLVVVKDGSINGGDASYLYLGQLQTEGEQLSGQLDIKQWNSQAPSIFGPLGNFSLSLTGVVSGDNLRISGGVVGQADLAIRITGRRLSDVT